MCYYNYNDAHAANEKQRGAVSATARAGGKDCLF